MSINSLDLIERVLAGKKYALSQILTEIENKTESGKTCLSALFPHSGRAYLIGITGAPGTGKSSLVNQLVLQLRDRFNSIKIAVIAVDPTSPFSGGAVLGDRIRMRDLSGDKNIFIRSMASRGSLGGLAKTTSGLVLAFDAAGYDYILIETVGAGQAEVDIAKLAHTILVVEAPGLGDDIQAIKSGILEIADVLVVNKADKPGADAAAKALQAMIEMAINHQPWITPVLKVSSIQGEGIDQLLDSIEKHKTHLESSDQRRNLDQKRLENELLDTIKERLFSDWHSRLNPEEYEMLVSKVYNREVSPDSAAEKLIQSDEVKE